MALDSVTASEVRSDVIPLTVANDQVDYSL